MNTTTEIWRDIPGCQSLYQVSNFGRVKSFKGGEHFLKPTRRGKGYKAVTVQRNGEFVNEYVHRLIAEAFIPNPDGKPQVNHINGDKTDNRVENLEWVTNAENIRHAYATGLQKQGEDCSWAKLTNEQVRFIRDNPDNLTGVEFARMFGVSPMTISLIQRGEIFKSAGGTVRNKIEHRIFDEAREQIRAEYKRGVHGHSYRALAQKFGVSTYIIWRAVHEK